MPCKKGSAGFFERNDSALFYGEIMSYDYDVNELNLVTPRKLIGFLLAFIKDCKETTGIDLIDAVISVSVSTGQPVSHGPGPNCQKVETFSLVEGKTKITRKGKSIEYDAIALSFFVLPAHQHIFEDEVQH